MSEHCQPESGVKPEAGSNAQTIKEIWAFIIITLTFMFIGSALMATVFAPEPGTLDYSAKFITTIMIAGASPSLAGIFLTLIWGGGWPGVKKMLAASLHWRVPLKWYLIVFLGPVGIAFVVVLIEQIQAAAFAITGPMPVPEFFAHHTFHPFELTDLSDWFRNAFVVLPMLIATGFLFVVPGNIIEEVAGWRGYLLPRLLETTSALKASLIIGLVWAVWHWPSWVTIGHFSNLFHMFSFTATVMASSILMTWVYIGTNRSVLLSGVLLHMMGNAVIEADVLFPTNYAYAPAFLVAALLVVAYYGVDLGYKRPPSALQNDQSAAKA